MAASLSFVVSVLSAFVVRQPQAAAVASTTAEIVREDTSAGGSSSGNAKKSSDSSATDRALFKHTQEMLEKFTEHLQGLLERPISDVTKQAMLAHDYVTEVQKYATATRKYLVNATDAIEYGVTNM